MALPDSGHDIQFRHTKQKSIILEAVKSLGDEHFTADGLIDLLKSKGVSIGRATVYRFLKQLEDMGEIKKYFLHENSCACFQYIGNGSRCNDHCHVMCSKCGKVLHVEDELLNKFARKIKVQNDFEIDDSRTVFYGVCSNCKGRKPDIKE